MSCHANEFADAVEATEPKFARWMRSHGKLAVLKDDEIERLERAGAATMGTSRAEVMNSMYNRLEPKPKGKAMPCRCIVCNNRGLDNSVCHVDKCSAQPRLEGPCAARRLFQYVFVHEMLQRGMLPCMLQSIV